MQSQVVRPHESDNGLPAHVESSTQALPPQQSTAGHPHVVVNMSAAASKDAGARRRKRRSTKCICAAALLLGLLCLALLAVAAWGVVAFA